MQDTDNKTGNLKGSKSKIKKEKKKKEKEMQD